MDSKETMYNSLECRLECYPDWVIYDLQDSQYTSKDVLWLYKDYVLTERSDDMYRLLVLMKDTTFIVHDLELNTMNIFKDKTVDDMETYLDGLSLNTVSIKKFVLAGTGHRPDKIFGYDLSNTMNTRLRNGIVNYLISLCAIHEEVEVISGMALGFDTILAQAVLIAKKSCNNIKLRCAIPCLNHTAKWQPDSVAEWNRIVSLADLVVNVTAKTYTPSCMQLRNVYMIDNCDEVITYFNGTAGGTKNCIDYAISKGKKIIKLCQK